MEVSSIFTPAKSLGAYQVDLDHCTSDHPNSFRFGRLPFVRRKTVEIVQRERRTAQRYVDQCRGVMERQRIAPELHDDFSQRLAVLALRLENVDEATPASFLDVHRQLRELVKSTGEIGADIHSLSHQLHSSTLESLGLVPAVAAMCREFTALQAIKVGLLHRTRSPNRSQP